MKFRAILVLASIALALSPVTASAAAANFGGTWNFTMKTTKDGCGMGLKGKSQPINNVVVKQKGSRASLTISGVKFSGKVTGKSMKGSGKYKTSGITISGTINATLKSRTKMSIPSTKIKISSRSASCTLVMKGSGVKVG